MRTRCVHLLRRPTGVPAREDFEVVDVPLAPLRSGEVLVRNLWMSVEPYMRRCMEETTEDQVPWPLRGPLNGPSVGVVAESRNAAYSVGDVVESLGGWQEHFVSDGSKLIPFSSSFTSLATRSGPCGREREHLGLLGLASFTGYLAIEAVAEVRAGDTVVVSSAAGTVGSVACQVAKIRGARVVGSAGTDEKVTWLRRAVGVDAAFNHRTSDLSAALIDCCPGGIDVVLENASTRHLDACLPLMNRGGRVVVSGLIELYSTGGKAPPVTNFHRVENRGLSIRAFRYMDHLERHGRFAADMMRWVADGRMQVREVVYHGIEAAASALCDLLEGRCWGKPLVRLSPCA